ncbi:MAG: Transcriptional regulator, TetR family [Nocardioides sp.]|nr:Transcriptional regulator, TetR family [Nocardioides sp.]
MLSFVVTAPVLRHDGPMATRAPRTARAIARAELTRAILDSAGQQLAEIGPAALSVRAVARDLGMASSAVYRYFPSRDALLTALLIEAYDDLGEAVEGADAAVTDRDDLDGRWHGICHAIRNWARAEPHRYALLYGSPVPGYSAPDDTVTSAVRVTTAFLSIYHDAQVAGHHPATTIPLTDAEQAALVPIRSLVEPRFDDDWSIRGLQAWATVFGTISLELFGHMYRGVLDYDAHFAQLVDQLAADLGLGE